jgi:hypothetical protein
MGKHRHSVIPLLTGTLAIRPFRTERAGKIRPLAIA